MQPPASIAEMTSVRRVCGRGRDLWVRKSFLREAHEGREEVHADMKTYVESAGGKKLKEDKRRLKLPPRCLSAVKASERRTCSPSRTRTG